MPEIKYQASEYSHAKTSCTETRKMRSTKSIMTLRNQGLQCLEPRKHIFVPSAIRMPAVLLGGCTAQAGQVCGEGEKPGQTAVSSVLDR